MQNMIGLKKLFVFAWLLLLTTVAFGQTYRPAIEHESLMSMRFYEATGAKPFRFWTTHSFYLASLRGYH